MCLKLLLYSGADGISHGGRRLFMTQGHFHRGESVGFFVRYRHDKMGPLTMPLATKNCDDDAMVADDMARGPQTASLL
jgi:hypothetical protein